LAPTTTTTTKTTTTTTSKSPTTTTTAKNPTAKTPTTTTTSAATTTTTTTAATATATAQQTTTATTSSITTTFYVRSPVCVDGATLCGCIDGEQCSEPGAACQATPLLDGGICIKSNCDGDLGFVSIVFLQFEMFFMHRLFFASV
jgi:hypothetical protein